MTKTQPNRITIYIMNLWAKRIGQLTLLAVALFFFSCEQETSILGYRNPNSKFKVSYVELPIESSVLLLDSLRTSNFFHFKEVNRFLVGSYTDAELGTVTSTAYTQFFPSLSGFTKPTSTAEFDSVSLQLRFDLYNYGDKTVTPQLISVYELDQELRADSLRWYFNKSNRAYSSLLGTKTFSIYPIDFDEFAASTADRDTVITIKMRLDASFGQRIFDSALKFSNAASAADSTFARYSEFIKEFKGLVLKPQNTDKMVGFNPSAAESRITIHYHDAEKDSLSFNLSFSSVAGFNQITSDRSATELSGLTNYNQPFIPPSGKRYIQSGTGIFTKLDFSNFYVFADTVPNVLINSAELVIESVQPSAFPPPSLLSLRILNDNNNQKRFSRTSAQDQMDLVGYQNALQRLLGFDIAITNSSAPLVDSDSVFYATDRSALLAYSSSTNSYRISIPLFLQQLTLNIPNRTDFNNFILYPASEDPTTTPAAESAAKTVNRAIFPGDKIKLKIYYTKPNTDR